LLAGSVNALKLYPLVVPKEHTVVHVEEVTGHSAAPLSGVT
jgi:hypothetical protein